MTQHSRRARRTKTSLRLWSYDQLNAAAPYITSILRSLREHAVALNDLRRRHDNLVTLSDRPTRQTIIRTQETVKDITRAEDELTAAGEELESLGLAQLDVAKGLALAPFMHDDQLAWFLFDLHDTDQVRFWRFQTDPDDARRRVTFAQMQ